MPSRHQRMPALLSEISKQCINVLLKFTLECVRQPESVIAKPLIQSSTMIGAVTRSPVVIARSLERQQRLIHDAKLDLKMYRHEIVVDQMYTLNPLIRLFILGSCQSFLSSSYLSALPGVWGGINK